MGKEKCGAFSEAEFLKLIKDDKEAITKYKKEIMKLYTRQIYSEDQVIELFTGKTREEVYSEFTIPELMRVKWAVDFLMDNLYGNKYINMLVEKEKKRA